MDINVLHKVMSALEEISVTYWIDQGTLLGLYRDGKIIDWDSDFDIGIINRDKKTRRKILRALSRHFQLAYYDITCEAIKIPFKTGTNGGWSVDIAFYRRRGNNVTKIWPDYQRTTKKQHLLVAGTSFLCSSMNNLPKENNTFVAFQHLKLRSFLKRALMNFCGACPPAITIMWAIVVRFITLAETYTPAYFFETISHFTVGEHTYPAPSPIEDFLTFKYGSDWKTPRKEWNYLIDDGALAGQRTSAYE